MFPLSGDQGCPPCHSYGCLVQPPNSHSTGRFEMNVELVGAADAIGNLVVAANDLLRVVWGMFTIDKCCRF